MTLAGGSFITEPEPKNYNFHGTNDAGEQQYEDVRSRRPVNACVGNAGLRDPSAALPGKADAAQSRKFHPDWRRREMAGCR